MIFARTSHTLLFVGGILLLVAFVADERGALGTVAAGAEGAQLSPAEGGQLAARQAEAAQASAQADTPVEEVADGWDDDFVVDDMMAMPEMDPDPDPVTPDNTGEDIYDPDAGVFSPEPDGGDW